MDCDILRKKDSLVYMKAILIDWNAYGNEKILAVLREKGYDVILCPFSSHITGREKELALADIREFASSAHVEFIFSYHFFPEISNICQKIGLRYIAWIYDSPAFNLYSPTILNDVNRIFVFDRGVSDIFQAQGITTVFHMPLGVYYNESEQFSASQIISQSSSSTEHADNLLGTEADHCNKYLCDISFVGSMYDEPKHDLYRRFDSISPYVHGYLDAIIEAQKHIYGANILESMITPEIEAEMQKGYPTNPNSANAMTPAQIYSQFVLSRKVTSIERHEILEMLGKRGYNIINLYTPNSTLHIPGIHNCGPVEYGPKMSKVFALSRINLNITLRSILTGIPLRALDVMNAGGFLLSNYQEELCDYFIPGKEFDFYSDYDDLCAKVDYYLSHERERRDIAHAGQLKVQKDFSLSGMLDKMLKII